MSSSRLIGSDYLSPPATQTTWQRWAGRLARFAFLFLVVTIIFGLIAGVVVAIAWRPDVHWTVWNLPYQFQSTAFLLVLVLSLPSLLVGTWDCVLGRWGEGASRLLAFVGLFIVIFGTEVGSHLLILCDSIPGLCKDGDIYVRTHQLHHTLVAGMPLTLLYWFALRR